MATTILFFAFVFILLGAAVTLPISQDLKSVSSSESSRNVKVNDKQYPDTTLNSKDTVDVKSLGPVYFDRAMKRTKRQVITGHHSCAQGMVWFWNMCITLEKYKKLKGEDYDDD